MFCFDINRERRLMCLLLTTQADFTFI